MSWFKKLLNALNPFHKTESIPKSEVDQTKTPVQSGPPKLEFVHNTTVNPPLVYGGMTAYGLTNWPDPNRDEAILDTLNTVSKLPIYTEAPVLKPTDSTNSTYNPCTLDSSKIQILPKGFVVEELELGNELKCLSVDGKLDLLLDRFQAIINFLSSVNITILDDQNILKKEDKPAEVVAKDEKLDDNLPCVCPNEREAKQHPAYAVLPIEIEDMFQWTDNDTVIKIIGKDEAQVKDSNNVTCMEPIVSYRYIKGNIPFDTYFSIYESELRSLIMKGELRAYSSVG